MGRLAARGALDWRPVRLPATCAVPEAQDGSEGPRERLSGRRTTARVTIDARLRIAWQESRWFQTNCRKRSLRIRKRGVAGMTAPGRVLVVDDNQMNRALLRERLVRQALYVEEAGDGHDALRKLAAKPFDLVLLDVMMPVRGGFDTLRSIKTDPGLCEVPVLMISAFGEIDSVVRCLQLGAEDYLPKPFEPAVLRARVGTCLERKQPLGPIAFRAEGRAAAAQRAAALHRRSAVGLGDHHRGKLLRG